MHQVYTPPLLAFPKLRDQVMVQLCLAKRKPPFKDRPLPRLAVSTQGDIKLWLPSHDDDQSKLE